MSDKPTPGVLMSELPSQALARLGEQIFGSDWAAPMSRMTGVNARTLLRIKTAAADGRDYRGALEVISRLRDGLSEAAGHADGALVRHRNR